MKIEAREPCICSDVDDERRKWIISWEFFLSFACVCVFIFIFQFIKNYRSSFFDWNEVFFSLFLSSLSFIGFFSAAFFVHCDLIGFLFWQVRTKREEKTNGIIVLIKKYYRCTQNLRISNITTCNPVKMKQHANIKIACLQLNIQLSFLIVMFIIIFFL